MGSRRAAFRAGQRPKTIPIAAGRPLEPADVDAAAKVALLGATVARRLSVAMARAPSR